MAALGAVERQRVNIPDFHTRGIARVRRRLCLLEAAGAKRQHHLQAGTGVSCFYPDFRL
jgi:hypothetical protein